MPDFKQKGDKMENSKESFKPGNMLYPVPAVLVSCAGPDIRPNVFTVAWTGTVCSDPAMLSVSIRPERYSYEIIRKTGEFAVNLTTKALVRAVDFCGVRSGRDVDKFKETGLTPIKAPNLEYAPLIAESPVNIECKVTEVKPLGSHDMFLAKIVGVEADKKYMDENGRFDLNKTELIVYSHGTYMSLGKPLGTFGFSVKKKK